MDLQRGAGLREATRRAVRTQIAAAAVDLFAAHGFEHTTVDQIAAAVGMSQRSVFRYFATKEDMAVDGLAERGHEVAAVLRARPDAEPPRTALRHALDLCVSPGPDLGRARMLADTPALRLAIMRKHLQWTELLLPEMTRRLAHTDRPALAAGSIITATLSCLDVATAEWARGNGVESFADLFDAALAALHG
ncbi:TetR/AcrR family transcriptional regulator [Kutzneria sp. CA-103260]|uniref:TetR/AcrR family transcriptional regulator n=1 Tax=Kutzneria sp. CA-103260 TaxID=2802641 RepID=UPI001BA55988|nr:TetR/AcrR family transcriptional regulator [Kutzneria sp. CA-103260]QUQ66940.1 TetR family transcriptional regulator [Kutzneria sp. CA-103260]